MIGRSNESKGRRGDAEVDALHVCLIDMYAAVKVNMYHSCSSFLSQHRHAIVRAEFLSCPDLLALSIRDDGGQEKLETGEPCETVPPVATQPWLMTLKSSTPTWDETLVFAEGYRRLFSPDTLVLFELVDFVAGSSLKEARKVGTRYQVSNA